MNKSRVDVLAVCALSVFLLLSVACGGSSSSARDTSQGDTSNVGDASAIDIVLGDLNNDPDHGDSFSDGAQMLLDHPLLTAFTPTGAGTYGVNPEQNTTASVCPSPLSPDPSTGTGFRLDYILPSKSFGAPLDGGMFFPDAMTESTDWQLACSASNHMLLWLDLPL